MLQYVINRVSPYVGLGAVAVAAAGALEGIVTGAIFQLFLQTPQLGVLHWLLGRDFNATLEAAQLGGFIGFLSGLVSFTTIIVIFRPRLYHLFSAKLSQAFSAKVYHLFSAKVSHFTEFTIPA